jgi:spermidine/putrescine transport system substrate-binding protein
MRSGWVKVGAALLALWMGGIAACTSSRTPAGGKLSLALWSNFIPEQTIEEFRKKTGIQVTVSHYSSNEELLAKLQAGASGYDLAAPSDYMVATAIKLKLLRELDRSLIPQWKQVDSRFLGRAFDRENRFSVPQDWGATGIAIHRDRFTGKIQGWKDLAASAELSGRFTLLDDLRETLGAALKVSGFSLNSRKPEELRKAKEWLQSVKPRIHGFSSEPLAQLVGGEIWAAHAYQNEALMASRRTGGKVEFIFPAEGGTLYIDSWVIPAKAENWKEAHAFIDFILDSKVAAKTVDALLVAPIQKGIGSFLSPEVRSISQLQPSEEMLRRAEMIEDVESALQEYDRMWTELKAGA